MKIFGDLVFQFVVSSLISVIRYQKSHVSLHPYDLFNGRRRMRRVFWAFLICHRGYFCPFTPWLMSHQLI